jgi:hypothetical protein
MSQVPPGDLSTQPSFRKASGKEEVRPRFVKVLWRRSVLASLGFGFAALARRHYGLTPACYPASQMQDLRSKSSHYSNCEE